MNLLYALSAESNPLYQGKFGLHGRYQTYGQHSFIYDLIAANFVGKSDTNGAMYPMICCLFSNVLIRFRKR
jgi:hypothetical protein